MRFYDFFKEYGLGKDDLLMFANVLNEFQLAGGKNSCWCLKHNNFKKQELAIVRLFLYTKV